MSAQIIPLYPKQSEGMMAALAFINSLPVHTDAQLKATLDKAKQTCGWLRDNGYEVLGLHGVTGKGEPLIRINEPAPGQALLEQELESLYASVGLGFLGIQHNGCWLYWKVTPAIAAAKNPKSTPVTLTLVRDE